MKVPFFKVEEHFEMIAVFKEVLLVGLCDYQLVVVLVAVLQSPLPTLDRMALNPSFTQGVKGTVFILLVDFRYR